MTMNLPHALPSATMLTAVLAANLAVAEPFSLDPSHTALTFEIDHLGFSASKGAFRDVSADLNIDVARPDQSSAGSDTNQLEPDASLCSAGVFRVDAYESLAFTVTGIDMTSETEARATGDLTSPAVGETVKLTLNFEATPAG
ncbi:MAG: YceI family protein [Pseudomonadota bacterium]